MGYSKIINSGNFIEVFEYEKSLYKNSSRRSVKVRGRRERINFLRRTEGNIKRLRQNFIRLVRSNFCGGKNVWLFTLTIRQIGTIVSANEQLRLFFQRLRRLWGNEFSYIAVPEFQKRGAVHYHVIFFSNEHREELLSERVSRNIARLWGLGFVDVVETNGNDAIALYLAKYMSKGLHDVRLAGKKAFSCSRNVLRPVHLQVGKEFIFRDDTWDVDKSLEQYKTTYDTLYLGQCVYTVYKINGKN